MKSLELPVIENHQASSGCCLTPPALAARTAEWRRLARRGLTHVSEDSGNLVLRFKNDPEVESELRDLAGKEARCCSSLHFDISANPDELTLIISGPWQETPWRQVYPATGAEQTPSDITEFVRAKYAEAARRMGAADLAGGPTAGRQANACGAAYGPADLARLGPLKGVSLGCGNAIAAAGLKEGETVLDLGSGAGLDVFVAAGRVGDTGKVYGLDMTDEMLELAGENQRTAGVRNVQFLKGQMEQIPLPDESVDVIISNCVINLSPSKLEVFAEMSRVLTAGGRFVLSDVVADDQAVAIPADLMAWAGCLGGALTREEYQQGLAAAGLAKVRIEESHQIQPGYASVLIRGRKPASP